MFSQIDLFGKGVSLNFNGKDKSRSSTGAWFSLLFFGFVGWSIYQLGQDLVYRQDPKTITSEFFEENPGPMVISPDTFNFAFGLQHPTTYAHYINESIYTIEAARVQLVRTLKEDGSLEMNWTSTPLLMETCTKEHFGNLAPKFENIELNALFCLQRVQPELGEVRIQGVFESPIFEDVSVMIKQCDNRTSKVPCAPKETLDELLGGGWFAAYFTNLAIEPRNFSSPNLGYRDSVYTSMSNTYYKEFTLWLNHVEVTSDYGWLTEIFRDDHFIKFDRFQEYTNFRPNLNEMVNFVIRVGKVTTHYDRSYIKVQDVLAQTNGFVSAGIMIGFIILMPYSNMKFYERLINELFDVKRLKKQKKDQSSKIESPKLKKKGKQLQVVVDGNKERNSGGPKSVHDLTIDFLEKHAFISDSLHLSPTRIRNFAKPYLGPAKIDINSSQSIMSLGPFSPKDNSFKDKNCDPFSGEIKDSKCSEVDNRQTGKVNPHNGPKRHPKKKQTKPRQTQDIKPSDSILPNSSQFHPFTSYLLRDKPRKFGPPQKKILETFEVQSPDESFMGLESIILDKQERAQKKIKIHGINSHIEKVENNIAPQNDSEAKKAESEEKVEKEEKTDKEIDDEEITLRAGLLPSQLTKDSDRIDITFGEYIRSFFWKSKSLKEKLGLLDEGIRRIQERLNIFNLLKKLREVDKLKLLLLENEQFVLFDALPNPELSVHTGPQARILRKKSFSHSQLKETKFITEKRKHDLVKYSYVDLKKKRNPTMIDQKLIEIYDDIIDS